jgi:hypothetical protein
MKLFFQLQCLKARVRLPASFSFYFNGNNLRDCVRVPLFGVVPDERQLEVKNDDDEIVIVLTNSQWWWRKDCDRLVDLCWRFHRNKTTRDSPGRPPVDLALGRHRGRRRRHPSPLGRTYLGGGHTDVSRGHVSRVIGPLGGWARKSRERRPNRAPHQHYRPLAVRVSALVRVLSRCGGSGGGGGAARLRLFRLHHLRKNFVCVRVFVPRVGSQSCWRSSHDPAGPIWRAALISVETSQANRSRARTTDLFVCCAPPLPPPGLSWHRPRPRARANTRH